MASGSIGTIRTTYYLHSDGQGSTRVVTDASFPMIFRSVAGVRLRGSRWDRPTHTGALATSFHADSVGGSFPPPM